MGKEGIGDIYVKTITFTSVRPCPIETASLTLREIYIQVTTGNAKIGRQGKQTYPLESQGAAGNHVGIILQNIDLADLWILPGSSSVVVEIIGTTKD